MNWNLQSPEVYTALKKDWGNMKEKEKEKKSKNLTAAYSDTSFPDKVKEGIAEPEKHVV
jgi:hypothetical protein